MSTTAGILRQRTARGALRGARDRVIGFANMLAAARRASLDAERLYAMSDGELAEAGLTRGDIPQLLLRRHFP